MTLPVERTPKFALDADAAGLSDVDLGHLKTLLTISPFEGEQLTAAVPGDAAADFVGIYELGWPILKPTMWIYYAHTGTGSIWLIRLSASLRALDLLHGQAWLDAETDNCRQLYLSSRNRRR